MIHTLARRSLRRLAHITAARITAARITAARITAVGTAAVLVASTAPAALAAPAPATPEEQAGSWLVSQLTSGLVHSDQFGGYDDYGLTLDLAFALMAMRGKYPEVGEIDAAMAPNVESYTGAAGEVYAGSTAKLLVFAQSVGADPTSYGGFDLVLRLNQRVSTKKAIKGRIEDKSAFGDYANVIGQSLAARALATAGTGKAASALDFLLKQQCRSGYFRLNFTGSKTAKDQTCNGGNPKTSSAPDTDATAFAVLELSAMKGKTFTTKKRIAKAVAWLKRAQKSNGSFGGGTSTEAANTNSTGLAGRALGQVHACGAARDAARWIAKWQVGTDAAPLTGELGALAYDKAAYVAAQTDGITPELRDQWRRASTQAAPALGNLVLADCKAL